MNEERVKDNQRAIVESVFQVSPKITWCALVDREIGLILSRTREEDVDHAVAEEELMFAEIRAPFILEAIEHSPAQRDSLDYVQIRFERITNMIVPLKASYLVITVENDIPVDVCTEIVRRIRSLETNEDDESFGSANILSLMARIHTEDNGRSNMF